MTIACFFYNCLHNFIKAKYTAPNQAEISNHMQNGAKLLEKQETILSVKPNLRKGHALLEKLKFTMSMIKTLSSHFLIKTGKYLV